MIELTAKTLKYYRKVKCTRAEIQDMMYKSSCAPIMLAGDAWLDWLQENDPWAYAAAVRYYVKGYTWAQIAQWRGSGTPDAVRVELVARRNQFNKLHQNDQK